MLIEGRLVNWGEGHWQRRPVGRRNGGLGVISGALGVLDVKRNQRLRHWGARQSVECSEKSEEFFRGSGNLCQSRNRKGQQKESRQWKDRCRQIYSVFIERENLLVYTCKQDRDRDWLRDSTTSPSLHRFFQLCVLTLSSFICRWGLCPHLLNFTQWWECDFQQLWGAFSLLNIQVEGVPLFQFPYVKSERRCEL